MLADMLAPDGGFYSTRDADSEGEEGRYYVWTPDEVRDLLDESAYAAIARRFGLDDSANFEGKWHLSARVGVPEIAREMNLSAGDAATLIDDARSRLLAERGKRVAPDRDEKQLAAWNALAIRGFAIAGRALDRDDLVAAAVRAADSPGWRRRCCANLEHLALPGPAGRPSTAG